MSKSSVAFLSRKLHRWGAIFVLLPILVVTLSGLFLLLKKQVTWIQPPTTVGTEGPPSVSFSRILAAAQSIPEAGILTWSDVDRLDVRPGKGVVKVRGKSRMEVQVDATTGEVLQVATRRSDIIESLHDGSWFHDRVKLWVFLPCAVILLGLWISGLYLWLLPHLVRRRRKLKADAS